MPKGSTYPAMSTPTGSEKLLGVQGPNTEVATVQQISDFANVQAKAYTDHATAGVVGGYGFFQQVGTGSFGRTFQDKMQEKASFSDFQNSNGSQVKGDGIQDDTTGVTAALVWAAAGDRLLEATPGQRFLISSTITINLPCQIKMNRARFVAAPSFTGTTAVIVRNGQASPATSPGEHRYLDIGVQGPYGGESNSKPPNLPLVSLNALDGINFDGPVNQFTDINIDLWVEGFRDNLIIGGTNTYLLRFRNIHCGKFWRRGVTVQHTSNAGENLSIIGGQIFNGVATDGSAVAIYGSGLNQTSLYVSGLSLDYCDNLFYWNGTDGQLAFLHCHFENNNTNPYGILDSTSAYTHVSLTDCTLVPGGGGSGYISAAPSSGRSALFQIQGNGNAHLRFSGGNIQAYDKLLTEIVHDISTGSSSVSVSGTNIIASIHNPPLVGAKLNRLRNGNFEEGNFNGWTQFAGSGQTFTVDNGTPLTGMWSAKMVCTNSGTSGGVSQFVGVRPGERIIVRALVQTPSYTTGSVQLNVRWFDSANAQIGSPTFVDSGSNVATARYIGGPTIVPAGAATARIDLFVASFIGTALFDEAYAFAS